MIRITITVEAFEAIASTLPQAAWPTRDEFQRAGRVLRLAGPGTWSTGSGPCAGRARAYVGGVEA